MVDAPQNKPWSLTGRTCLITGVTQGIGRITALELAKTGCRLLLVARDSRRGAALVDEIKANNRGAAVELLIADLSSMAQVRRLATEVKAHTDRLDVLLNNAGAVFVDRQLSVDGFELTFALNHLAYFLLTRELLDLVRGTAQKHGSARIINVASNAHTRAGQIDFDNVMLERGYSARVSYCRSKLANILFTKELARRLTEEGVRNVTVNCLHPGFVASGFGHNNSRTVSAIMSIAGLFAISPEAGAKTSIYLATAPEAGNETGQYYVKCRPARSSRESMDAEAARRLWEVSEKLLAGVGIGPAT